MTKGRLVSFDVKSLFTNIPIAETIDVIRDHCVGPHPLFDLPINPLVFCDLLHVLTSYNQFNFDGTYYRQTSGVPMGSSLSPAMSNIFMEHFETSLMDDIIPANMKPLFWMRYVDDVLCCFEDLSTLDDFLTLLNSIRETITFTVELSRTSEADGFPLDLPANVCESLPFLELNVMRLTDGTYTFSIFRKPCHVGNYIHAYSYQPLFQKQSVIRSLFLRAFRYCDPQFLPSEEECIRQDFSKLGYTAKFIEEGKKEPTATLSLPYHPTNDE